jgi:3-hydroxymyristoyl/3-hydroxydecanoyl-(acyl carrier protein) dehydratase
MTRVIQQETIKEHIIHRYENLLLDEVTIGESSDNITGSFKLCIAKDDPLSRQIFSKNKESNKKILTPQLCMESLALASIVCSGKLEKGQMAIFAGISNFKKEKDIPFGKTIIGEVEKQGGKAGFLKFKGVLKDDSGELISSGNMMAYFVDNEMSNEAEEAKKIDPITLPENKTAIDKTSYPKPAQMVILDNILETKENSILGEYTYPTTHPFTKGHFPENPIMMGIMQWTSLEDLAFQFARSAKLPNKTTLKGNAVLFKKDFTIVAEIKGFECISYTNDDNILDQCDVLSTQKIVFRNMVRPGETIFISLNNIIIQ